jgi:hypothetical protein
VDLENAPGVTCRESHWGSNRVSTRKLGFRRIIIYVGIFSLLLYFTLAWARMLRDPDQRTGSDFIGFYSFGRIMETRGIQYLYEIDAQQNVEEEIVGHRVTPIFYTHIPLIAPLARLLVDEDYVASFKRWAVVLLLVNALNVYLLVNLLQVRRFTRENLFILCMGAFLFDPTFSGLMNGQDTALLLLGAVLWAAGLFSKKYFLSGIGLSLTVVRPQIALFLAIPFFFRERRVFWGFVVGGSILAGVSFALLRTEGTLKFLESLRYIEGTVWREPHALDMPTLSGLIRRNIVLSDPGPIQSFVWLCYVLGIAGFCLLFWKSAWTEERQVGLLSTVGILVVPYAHYHDLILLLVPIFCLLRIYQQEGVVHQNYLAVAPLGVSWLFALGFAGSGVLKFPIVYAIMLALVYFLITNAKPRRPAPFPISQ